MQTYEQRQAWITEAPDLWAVVRFQGRGRRLREECASLESAMMAARAMNTDPVRGVLVYAVRDGEATVVASINPMRKGRTVINVVIQYAADKALKVVQLNHESDFEKLNADLANDGCALTRVNEAKDLEKFSLQELMRLNNMLSQHQVKGFSTKPKGVARVFDRLSNKIDTPPEGADATAAQAENQPADAGTNEEDQDMAKSAAQAKAPKGRKPSAKKAAEARVTKGQKTSVAKRAAKKVVERQSGRGRAGLFRDEAKITVLHKDGNPKRAGSAAAEDWTKTLKSATVADAVKKGVSRADLLYNARKGFIKIEGFVAN